MLMYRRVISRSNSILAGAEPLTEEGSPHREARKVMADIMVQKKYMPKQDLNLRPNAYHTLLDNCYVVR